MDHMRMLAPYLLAALCATLVASEAGSLTDPNLRFIGRWDRSNPAVAQGSGPGPTSVSASPAPACW